MPTTQRRRDRGVRQADRLLRVLADELRDARIAAGLSLRAVAAASGISKSRIHRIEHARVRSVSMRTLAVLFSVVGMRLSARAFPDGPPVRDAGHTRLLERFRTHLAPTLKLRTEVPLRLDRDQRAWDGEVESPESSCKLEAETVLYDLQAQVRRVRLKMADDDVDVVILVVARTRRNQRILREFRTLLAATFPLDSRTVLRSLRAGRLPAESGIVVC